MVPSEGKETQELQEVVFETSSDIYKLEKVVETNEYEIPDLWKLKVAKSQKGSFNIVPSLKKSFSISFLQKKSNVAKCFFDICNAEMAQSSL